jgi:hypothetical protein
MIVSSLGTTGSSEKIKCIRNMIVSSLGTGSSEKIKCIRKEFGFTINKTYDTFYNKDYGITPYLIDDNENVRSYILWCDHFESIEEHRESILNELGL